MALQARTGLGRGDLQALITATIDVHVQLERRDGRRVVGDIRYRAPA